MVEMKLTRKVQLILNIFSFIILLSFVSPLIAEPAPVYDADALEQPYANESGGDQMQQDLPPPPNQSASDSAFIPIQSELQPSSPPSNSSRRGIERRLQRVEQQINNMQASDLSAQLESLQNQIQSLRAQVEQITKVMTETQNQQKSMYADFDNRLNQLSTASASGNKAMAAVVDAKSKAAPKVKPSLAQTQSAKSSTATKALATADNADTADSADSTNKTTDSQSQPNIAEEQKIYQNAYNMIKNKKYSDAVNVLQSMLQKYPSGQFASNAHYWLGELYGLLGKNDKALNEFDEVVKNFSDSPRVSDAMLKVGLIFAAQSKWNDAKGVVRGVYGH